MANEIQYHAVPNFTFYANITNSAGQYWNTGSVAFEAWNGANIALYAVPMVDTNGLGSYRASFPAGIVTAGTYYVETHLQVGAAPSTDDLGDGPQIIDWTGAALATDHGIASQVTGLPSTIWSNPYRSLTPYIAPTVGATFTITVGDLRPALTFAIYDNAGLVDLTGCTVSFLMRARDGNTNKINRAAAITDAVLGQVMYQWTGTDTDTAGSYLGYFRVVDGSGNPLSLPPVRIAITVQAGYV